MAGLASARLLKTGDQDVAAAAPPAPPAVRRGGLTAAAAAAAAAARRPPPPLDPAARAASTLAPLFVNREKMPAAKAALAQVDSRILKGRYVLTLTQAERAVTDYQKNPTTTALGNLTRLRNGLAVLGDVLSERGQELPVIGQAQQAPQKARAGGVER